ncbi:hypothetical protein A8H39_01820 [Paraburkholderia fungorum]|uniref:hypothetical protein n=1 Tax=Paraburkholderia fungorum TaxID=134537 RepID=UPI0005A85B3F|nr:hypothetical protein [Paraburkholderia fungorum]PNE59909.1 hypothetical protein A8H39_01820 [Paraburkholderia fungorum]
MTDDHKIVPLAPAGTVANAEYALRASTEASLFGEQEQGRALDFLCVCAAMTLTAEQRAKAVRVISGLSPEKATIAVFATACEQEPALVEFGGALKSRVGWSSSLLSSPDDSVEIDLKCVVDSNFDSGNGVLTFGTSTPDEVIVFSIRAALAVGKPFKVIPA